MGCSSSASATLPLSDGPGGRIAALSRAVKGGDRARVGKAAAAPRPRAVFVEASATSRLLSSSAAFLSCLRTGEGWVEHLDNETGRGYWHNPRTGGSSWEAPPVDPRRGAPPVDPALARYSMLCLQQQLLSKDYVSLRCDYERTLPYRCVRGQYGDIEVLPSSAPCVLCREQVCDSVIFPCQHACLCAQCVVKCNVGPPGRQPSAADAPWSSCPVCAEDIKKVTALTTSDVVAYWNWAYDVRQKLPHMFARRFISHAALVARTESSVQ